MSCSSPSAAPADAAWARLSLAALVVAGHLAAAAPQPTHAGPAAPALPTLQPASRLPSSPTPQPVSPPAPAVTTIRPLASPASPAVPATPPAAEVLAALPQARLIGKGALRFFGLPVYEARLWAAPGFDAARYDGQPFALELQYARKLRGPDIAERSITEMKRVGSFTTAQATAWQALMERAFPDVAAGDRLSGVHTGGGQVRFFHNGRPTAQLDDAAFARLFFGIWLAPQTSAPALRQALIGEAAGRDGG